MTSIPSVRLVASGRARWALLAVASTSLGLVACGGVAPVPAASTPGPSTLAPSTPTSAPSTAIPQPPFAATPGSAGAGGSVQVVKGQPTNPNDGRFNEAAGDTQIDRFIFPQNCHLRIQYHFSSMGTDVTPPAFMVAPTATVGADGSAWVPSQNQGVTANDFGGGTGVPEGSTFAAVIHGALHTDQRRLRQLSLETRTVPSQAAILAARRRAEPELGRRQQADRPDPMTPFLAIKGWDVTMPDNDLAEHHQLLPGRRSG